MKYVNFYSGMALVMIASILGSLGSTTGELAPPLIVGALLLTVLVLGWAGGASDARHEIEKLTRLEGGRQLKATCDAAARDRLEAMNEALHAQARDSHAAIELFTTSQAKNMIRITALEGENAELRKRPSAEVMIETAVRLMRENSADEDSDLEYLNGCAAGIAYMHTELLQQMMAPAAMDSHPSPAAGAAAGADQDARSNRHQAHAARRLLAAARVYAFKYVQDEAEDAEDCLCGEDQHIEAIELFDAIAEMERLAGAQIEQDDLQARIDDGVDAASTPLATAGK